MPQYLSTDPNAGAQPSKYLSTDPQAGMGVSPAGGGYLSTDPNAGTEKPSGFLDRIKAMSPRQWGATGVRALAGILSSEGFWPGAAIGGAGEGLAQWVGGEPFNPAQIATQSALSAVPLGRIFKAGKTLAEGAGLGERILAAGSQVGTNAARGAMLGTGQTAASAAFGEGRAPAADELKFGAIVGAGGGAAASGALKALRGEAGHVPGGVVEPRMTNEEAARTLMGGTGSDLPVGVRMPQTEAEAQQLILGAQPGRSMAEVDRLLQGMPTEPAKGNQPWSPQSLGEIEASKLGEHLQGLPSTDLETGQRRFGWGSMAEAGPSVPQKDALDVLRETLKLDINPDTGQRDFGFKGMTPNPEVQDALLALSGDRAALGTERAAMAAERDQFAALKDLLQGKVRRLEEGQPSADSLAGATQRPLFAPVNDLPPGASVRDLTPTILHSGEVPELPSRVESPVQSAVTPSPEMPMAGPQATAGAPGGRDPLETVRSLFKFGEAPYGPSGKRRLSLAEYQHAQETGHLPDIPAEFRAAPSDPMAEWLTRGDRSRSLMANERRAAVMNDERFSHLQGSESGFATPGPLYYAGAAGAGAVAGPLIDTEDDPRLAAFGGAGLGLLGVTATRNPAMLERLRFSNLFSGAAIPKSFLGNLGAVGAHMAENPKQAANTMRQFFTPQTARTAVAAFKAGAHREAMPHAPAGSSSILDLPGKLIGAPDAAARDVLQRSGASAADAGRLTLSGAPDSGPGQWIARGVSQYPLVRQILPVARTAANLVERGIERTPGLGMLPSVRAWSGATPQMAMRRQGLGALTMLASGAAGAASAPGGSLDDWGSVTPYVNALLGPYALPGAVAGVVGKTLGGGGSLNDVVRQAGLELQQQLPIPSVYTNPFSAPGRYAAQFVPFGGVTRTVYPIAPNQFETNGSFFAPAVSQVPFVNEALLSRRPPPRPKLGFERRR